MQMILTTKKTTGSGKRWALKAEKYFLLLIKEVLSQNSETQWIETGDYVCIGLRENYSFRIDHTWLDGPHCMWSFGWLFVGWSNVDCKKCLGDSTKEKIKQLRG
jgi:hypothetical protein